MNTKVLSILAFWFALADFSEVRAQGTAAPGPAYAITVLADHPDATYRVGEPVTFTVSVSKDLGPVKEGSISWSLTKDGVDPTSSGTSEIKDGVALVKGQLAEPGFLQCKVGFKTETAVIRGLGGAAVEPLKIQASLPVPEDFDAFWASKKAELAKVPLNAKMTPVETKYSGIDVFDVEAAAVGEQPMRGYYARPSGAKPKSCPAVITFEGAGVYNTRMDPWLSGWAKDGFISLEINAHGLPNGKPVDYYLNMETGALKDYQLFGRESRDTFYFLNMYLRGLQGVNFLVSQPEWDGRILVSNGTSQGAAQSIFVAAEDPRVTFLVAIVPAMCDHSGMMAGRVPGWPRLVPNDKTGKPDPAILQVSRYFDSVNFATRLKVPAFFAAGFIDQTTPPTTVYAAYNSVQSPKEMFPAILSPHRVDPDVFQTMRRRVLALKESGL